MAQAAIHGIVGVGLGRVLARRGAREESGALMVGACLGAMAPDIDLFPAIVATGLGWDRAVEVLHRSATHSLLAVLLVLGAAGVASVRSRRWSVGLTAAAVGMGLHLLLDVFMWFGSVDLFWPLSVLGLAPKVYLWGGFHHPALLGRPDLFDSLLHASEPVLNALMLLWLCRSLSRRGVSADRLRGIRRWTAASVVWTLAAVGLCFVAPTAIVRVVAWGPWLVFTAYLAVQLVRFRHVLVGVTEESPAPTAPVAV